jgi:hypothetical protein
LWNVVLKDGKPLTGLATFSFSVRSSLCHICTVCIQTVLLILCLVDRAS